MDRSSYLHRTDAGYVVSHFDRDSGEHIETAVTLAAPIELELDDRGHEIVLPERARARARRGEF